MDQFGPIFVKGVPAPFATEAREVAWKNTIRQHILGLWTLGSLEEPCVVHLRFLLPPKKAEETDIDNLLKPCIDALGSVLFKPARRGHQVIWNADDHWIYKIVATCGVEIIVSPHNV